MSVPSSCMSRISIDLGLSDSAVALQHLVRSKRSCKVKGAVVHAKSCAWCEPLEVDQKGLSGVFRSLGSLPGLQELTVDIGEVRLPLTMFTKLLACRSLNILRLSNIALQGSAKQYAALERAMEEHRHLSLVSIRHCCGTQRLLPLLARLTSIEQVEVIGTKIANTASDAGATLMHLCQAPNLTSLSLKDNPGMRREHFLSMCEYLSQPQYRGNLTELKVKSNFLAGAGIGELIVSMLQVNRTIRKVELQICLNETSSANTLASILASNSSLVCLDLRLLGGLASAVLSTGAMVVEALKSPSSRLKSLRLHLDVDSYLDGNLLNTEFMRTLEQTLEVNDLLQECFVLEDCSEPFELSARVLEKLQLNRSGLPRLLRRKRCNSVKYQNAYVDAIIASKKDLNSVFYAISQDPYVVSLS